MDQWFGRLKASFSDNFVAFATLDEPLIPVSSESGAESIRYPSIVSYDSGDDHFTWQFNLFYSYIQPNEDSTKRYLVGRNVTMVNAGSPQDPNVGLELSRWDHDGTPDLWATTAMVPNNKGYQGSLGFLMTKPHPTKATIELWDCVSKWPGYSDHMVTGPNTCVSSYTKLRTLGWVFQNSQPNTRPLYRCYNSSNKTHFASNNTNCDGLGKKEWLLGYILDQ